MRLLGEIFRPSRNQVTWGWGKLAMRGARMTAASPWDTLCCVSLSSKLPMSAKRAGEPRQGLGRGWQRARGLSRVQSRVRLGSRLEATGMGSPRGRRGAALGSAPCSAGAAQLAQGMGWWWASIPGSAPAVPGAAQPPRPHARLGTPAPCPPPRAGSSRSEEGSVPGLPGISPCPIPRLSAGSIPARPGLHIPLPSSCPAARRLEARSG